MCCSTRPVTLSACAGTTADRSTRCRARGHDLASGQPGARTDQGDPVGPFLFDPHPLWFHRMANLRAKIPEEAAPEFMAGVRAIRDAPNLEAVCAQAILCAPVSPVSFLLRLAFLEDDVEALLVIHRLPLRHRLACRTRISDRAELRGRTPAIEGDPALFRRAQSGLARVHNSR